MTGRLVYLDTADWSYLETGRYEDATKELRKLGHEGRVTYVITLDHILECVGLTSGRGRRLDFMRTFPGTVLLKLTGAQVLKWDVLGLASMLLDQPEVTKAVECTPMCEHALDELLDIAKALRPLHFAHDLSARASVVGSSARGKESRQVRQQMTRLHRLAREGDIAQAIAHVEKVNRDKSWLRRKGGVLAARGLVRFYAWMRERGLTSAASDGDFLFDTLVTAALGPELAKIDGVMRGMKALWKDRQSLSVLSPSLAVTRAICERAPPSKDPAKVRSTEVDRQHACFAPLMDVFSCDRRTYDAIHALLVRAEIPVTVIRTQSLPEIAQILVR